jgi:hypothetical protein
MLFGDQALFRNFISYRCREKCAFSTAIDIKDQSIIISIENGLFTFRLPFLE